MAVRYPDVGQWITAADIGDQLFVGREPHHTKFQTADHTEARQFSQKPSGGPWTSSYINGASDWVRWCRSEEWGDVDNTMWWKLQAYPDTVLLQIDSFRDLSSIMAWCGIERDPGDRYSRKYLDWAAIRDAGFQGVHLTDNGNNECRSGRFDIGYDLNSWDVESTVWFEWVFTDIRPVPNDRLGLILPTQQGR